MGTNITNPKVLVFYLAVLPQFLRPGAGPGWLLAFAWSHARLGLMCSLAVVAALARIRAILSSRSVRRAMDATTGTVLLGFSTLLAVERAQNCSTGCRRPSPFSGASTEDRHLTCGRARRRCRSCRWPAITEHLQNGRLCDDRDGWPQRSLDACTTRAHNHRLIAPLLHRF
ncbi:MAG: LysE family translocator [Candidatus Dormibacteria bacterium]